MAIHAKDNQQVKAEQHKVLLDNITFEQLNTTKYFPMHLESTEWFNFIPLYHDNMKETAAKFGITENAVRSLRSDLRDLYKQSIPTNYTLVNFGLNTKYYINRDGYLLDSTNRFVSVSYEHRKYYHRYVASIYQEGTVDPRKHHYAHRLMALTFIPNPFGYDQVNHINGIHNDNRVENLEWMSNAQNMEHSLKDLTTRVDMTVGEKNGRHILTEEQVVMYRKLYAEHHINTAAIATIEGMSPSAVISMLNGKNWPHLTEHIDTVKKRMNASNLTSETIESIAELETIWRRSE